MSGCLRNCRPDNPVYAYWSIYNSKNGDDIVFGMDFYKVLIEYIKICVGDLYVDGRPFYLLYDHKRLMQYRMEYLANNGVHKNLYKKLSEDYKDLVEQAETLQLFVQKYKVAKRDTLASKIINCLQSMEMKEVEILKPLVDLCNYGDIL
jgi:hypothetical protein